MNEVNPRHEEISSALPADLDALPRAARVSVARDGDDAAGNFYRRSVCVRDFDAGDRRAEIAIGLVRCLCTHAQLRVALVIIRRKLAGGRSGVPTARSPQRVSVTGAGEDVSDGEGVGVMFLLMRYQIVIATRREINFARQFSSVSLVHRTETNIARQFFEVCPFIIAVQQNFPRGIKIIRCQVGVWKRKEFARVPLRVVLR